jgi:hypothetical protein
VCAGIFLLAEADALHASGLNLGWGPYCPTSVNSLVNINDPCDGTLGPPTVPYTLIGTVVAPNPAPTMCIAEDFFVDIQEGAAALSDYWHLENQNQPGYANFAGCRGANSNGNVSSLQIQAGDPSFPASFAPCVKFWGTSPVGVINYGVHSPDNYPGVTDPRRARLIGHFTKSPGTAMAAGTQYGVFVATLDTNHQTGVDVAYGPPYYLCSGCADGVCLVFNELILYQPPGTPNGNIDVTVQDTHRIVTWQGGGFDCTTVPVKRSTWGQVKSLYR